MSSSVRLTSHSSVCLSVTFVHPTQVIEIFGNVATPFSTFAISWYPGKILRRSLQGNPPSGELNTRGVANIAILDLSNAISRKQCKTGGKLVLITNRKSHMSFWLVPNSVTLDDLERRNSPNRLRIFRADYFKKWLKIPILSAAEM